MSQLDFPPFQKHSDTSRAAAARIHGEKRRKGRVVVLEFLIAQGSYGATDNEIIEATGLNPSTARPRRIDLMHDGLVEDSGRRRDNCTVWVAA